MVLIINTFSGGNILGFVIPFKFQHSPLFSFADIDNDNNNKTIDNELFLELRRYNNNQFTDLHYALWQNDIVVLPYEWLEKHSFTFVAKWVDVDEKRFFLPNELRQADTLKHLRPC